MSFRNLQNAYEKMSFPLFWDTDIFDSQSPWEIIGDLFSPMLTFLLFHWLQTALIIDSTMCSPSVFLLHRTWNCQAWRTIQFTEAIRSHWLRHLFLPDFKSIFYGTCHMGLTYVTRCCYMLKWCITIRQNFQRIIYFKYFSIYCYILRKLPKINIYGSNINTLKLFLN